MDLFHTLLLAATLRSSIRICRSCYQRSPRGASHTIELATIPSDYCGSRDILAFAPAPRRDDKVPISHLAAQAHLLDTNPFSRSITLGSMDFYDFAASSSSVTSTPSPRVRPFDVDDVPDAPRRRNPQVPLDFFLEKMAEHTGWSCPFCDYEQVKKRRPDFKRHVYTHCPDAELYDPSESSSPGQRIRKRWCCGVPVHLAAEYGVHPPYKTVIVVDGVENVGGCDKKVSRVDALRRHIQNPSNSCVSTIITRVGAEGRKTRARKARRGTLIRANGGKKVGG